MNEIFKLKELLIKADIPFEFYLEKAVTICVIQWMVRSAFAVLFKQISLTAMKMI